MGRFRVRKGIPIIPGFLRLNASASAGRGKTSSGTSWTIHLGKLISYNTRTGVTSINPPGPGSWQSAPRSTRQKAKERKKALKAADREYWRQYAEDKKAGREPDMRGAPSRRGPNGQLPRKRRTAPAGGAGRAGRRSRSQPAARQSTGRQPSRTRSQPDGVVHPAEPRPAQPTVGGVPVTASGVPMRPLRPAEYGFLTEAQRDEYAALPMSMTGITAGEDSAGKTQEEWAAGLFPEYGGLRAFQRARAEREVADERAEQAVSAMDALGMSQEEYNRLPLAERQEIQRGAGNCGAITKDGTPCLNSKNCPVPSHRSLV